MNIKPSKRQKHLKQPYSPIIRRYIAAGGTIAGSITANGGYIAGTYSQEQQERMIIDALDIASAQHICIQTIGILNTAGSQNITTKDIGKLAEIIIDAANHNAQFHNKGILITTGTDKIGMMTHYLNMLFPDSPMPIILTAAMCPPGGVDAAIGEYEDGPVNLRSAEHLLRLLEETEQNIILAVIEDQAYVGHNIQKILPYGVKNAFRPRIGNAAYRLKPLQSNASLIKDSGNPALFSWVPTSLTENILCNHNEFAPERTKILQMMASDDGFGTSIVTDNGQNNIHKDIKCLSYNNRIIGYQGVGNGNINVRDSLKTIEDIILQKQGHCFIRGSATHHKPITNNGCEASNQLIFQDIAPDKNYKLTEFMIPQNHFTVTEATQIVGMIYGSGLIPPMGNSYTDITEYLEAYKDYIRHITRALESPHPVWTACKPQT